MTTPVGDVAHDEPELRRALLVEHDLDFRIAGLDGRLDVGEARIGEHAFVRTCSAAACSRSRS